MSTAPETTGDTETVQLSITEFPAGGDAVELRHIVAGIQPFILIEPNEDGSDDDIHFNVAISVVDMDTAAATLQVLGQAIQAELDILAAIDTEAEASK